MTETRQQRRARERAEKKLANRPGPNDVQDEMRRPAPEPEDRAMGEIRAGDVVEIDLNRIHDDSDDQDDSWSTSWSVRDGLWGVGDDAPDLDTAVQEVMDDVRQSAGDLRVPIEWNVGGDYVAGVSPDTAVEAAEIILPKST